VILKQVYKWLHWKIKITSWSQERGSLMGRGLWICSKTYRTLRPSVCPSDWWRLLQLHISTHTHIAALVWKEKKVVHMWIWMWVWCNHKIFLKSKAALCASFNNLFLSSLHLSIISFSFCLSYYLYSCLSFFSVCSVLFSFVFYLISQYLSVFLSLRVCLSFSLSLLLSSVSVSVCIYLVISLFVPKQACCRCIQLFEDCIWVQVSFFAVFPFFGFRFSHNRQKEFFSIRCTKVDSN
jgi:hypothetical protein